MSNITKIKDKETGVIYPIEDSEAREEISDLKSQISSSQGMSTDFKIALENLLEEVAYTTANGQTLLSALHTAMYPPANLTSISAVYSQSGTVYDDASLDSLKSDLVVTAHYSDGTSEIVTSYTLSGTLTEGTSIITVAYGGKSTTFNVIVAETVHLPEGYTKYDYLYSDADSSASGSFINTGVCFGSSTTKKLIIDFQSDGTLTSQEYPIGTRQTGTGSTNNLGWAVGLNATHDALISWSSTNATFAVSDGSARYLVEATHTSSNTTINVNNSEVQSESGTTRSVGGYPIILFGIKHAVTSGTSGAGTPYFMRGKIYYAEAQDDGVPIMKCYPCIRNSDGQAGMYDLVNNAFYEPYCWPNKSITAGND